MQTCGAHPRRVRVEWRDGGGWTHLGGVTELGRMMGNDPNLALSVLHRLGRWEAGRSVGGMVPQRKGWVRVHDRAGETSSSSKSNNNTTATPPPPTGRGHSPQGPHSPPPKAPKKKSRHFESSEEDAPPPRSTDQAQAQGQAQAQRQGQWQGHPPPKPQAPPLEDRGRDAYGNVPGVGDPR